LIIALCSVISGTAFLMIGGVLALAIGAIIQTRGKQGCSKTSAFGTVSLKKECHKCAVFCWA
jgi:hypothetical protein